MRLNEISDNEGATKNRKRVGRGELDRELENQWPRT